MVGKPYALVGQVRFDEGGQDFGLGTTLNGHEAGNGGYSQGLSLKKVEPVLYSTSNLRTRSRTRSFACCLFSASFLLVLMPPNRLKSLEI